MAQFSPTYGYYDVTAAPYNCVGDGVTDDTSGIQQALNDAATVNNGGGAVYFPPGTYLISNELQVATSAAAITVLGANPGACTVKLSTSFTTVGIATITPGSHVEFANVTFQGNGVGYTTLPGADAITVGKDGSAVTSCRFRNCKFTLTNIGPTIHFYNTIDGEVVGCHFFKVGSNIGVHGSDKTTPAVYIEQTCTNIRVHNNHFEQYKYDAIRNAGSACEASSNYCFNGFASGVLAGENAGQGDGSRFFGNFVDTTQKVQQGNQGVYVQVARNFQVIGNTVTKTDGDGIAGGAQGDGVFIGNVSFDNSQNGGDCGIQYITQGAGDHPNVSVAFIGNVSYDDEATPAQQFGIRMINSDVAAQNFILAANTFWGNAKGGIELDPNVLNDESNTTISNASWTDRQHKTSNTITSTTKVSLVSSPNITIDPYSMNQRAGLRIIASGKTTSGSSPGARTFYLGFGISGNLMNAVNAGTTAAAWQLEAYIYNANASEYNAQNAFVHFWYNGSLIYHAAVSLPAGSGGIDTTVSEPIVLEGKLAKSSDSIVTHLLSVERV